MQAARLRRPRRRARRAVAVALAAAATGAGVGVVSASPAAQAVSAAYSLTVRCPSPALGGVLPAVVYLPAGYLHRSTRYPVIYFLHGLPAGPASYTANGFVADAVAAGGHQALVVSPQGAREEGGDREYLDWAPDEDWPTAIAHDLTTCIDHRFRTIAARTGRALVGLSAGGFGAFNIGLRRLRTFAALESWSGYFAATDPSGLTVLDLGSESANRRARVPTGDRISPRLTGLPTFIAFFVGRQDTRFYDANVALDASLAGYHIKHLFAVYPGAHSGALWRKWAPLWLGYALAHLRSATAGRAFDLAAAATRVLLDVGTSIEGLATTA